MNEEYLDVSLDDIYDELINYNISLKDVASMYKFPSEKDLKNALKKYCKKFSLPLPKQIEKPEEFFTEQEEEIYQLKEQYHLSEYRIAHKYKITTYAVHKALRKFDKIDKEKRPKAYINPSMSESIRINEEKSENKTIKKDKNTNHSRKIEISEQEVIDAYLNNDYSKFSHTTIRKRLIEICGETYTVILKGDKKGEEAKEFAKLYENGISCEEIAQANKISINVVRDRLNSYYRTINIKRPKIMSKKDFNDYINTHDNINIENMIEAFRKMNIHIPEPYIEEYLRKTGEIDLRKVKAIVNKEFIKLQKEGKNPNLIEPFEFANEVKLKGYNTKYQATALLYQIISNNNLPIDIALELNNEEVMEALHVLVDSKESDKINYLRNIENNKIAKLIYHMQNKTYYLEYEKE